MNSTAVGYLSVASGQDSLAVGELAQATNTSTTAVGGESVASGLAATAFGWQANATGERAHALGHLAQATGDFSLAVGEAANASGVNASAIGSNAMAAFDRSMAIGAGASTTRADQVVVGTASSTYTMPGIASDASRAAQSGPTSYVTTDANGNLATDGGGMSRRFGSIEKDVEDNTEGVALALALQAPFVPYDKRYTFDAGFGAFKDKQAFSTSAAFRVSDNVQFNAGIGVGLNEGNIGGRGGVSISW